MRLFRGLFSPPAHSSEVLRIGTQNVPIHFIRNRRARRYLLRVRPDGSVRATVPRVGSLREARAFAERNRGWIATQLQQRAEQPTEILYRGDRVRLNHAPGQVTFADQTIPLARLDHLRPAIERHLWQLARPELVRRTQELAALHNVNVPRVTVRNQRSRWGSCSRRGTISLNWRLIQAPAFVRDYIILHELMHRREMNHSARFWQHVAAVCPEYRPAEVWLKQQRGLLH